MEEALQIITGMLGTLGFSILFHVRGKKLIPIALGGAISWAVYLLVVRFHHNSTLGILISTAVLGLIAEIFARFLKSPAILFLVPMLIPLIPGSTLYYTTRYLVLGNGALFTQYGNRLLLEAGAIAFGIILVAGIVHLPLRLWKPKR